MMKAELRSLSSSQFDPETGQPEDPRCFCALIEAYIGPVGDPGEEVFRLYISTPEWLRTRTDRGEHVWADRFLVVDHWDYGAVVSAIRRRVAKAQGTNWSEIARGFSTWMDWEFGEHTRDA